ncbi:hypothetical protein [Paenibacillus sp. KN14-4R]|uniref:hypothetical protein n=1 Tax=Paenibacillus sp. KN14-4R TaxID=3445773 RepID=UPI003FA059BE
MVNEKSLGWITTPALTTLPDHNELTPDNRIVLDVRQILNQLGLDTIRSSNEILMRLSDEVKAIS